MFFLALINHHKMLLQSDEFIISRAGGWSENLEVHISLDEQVLYMRVNLHPLFPPALVSALIFHFDVIWFLLQRF